MRRLILLALFASLASLSGCGGSTNSGGGGGGAPVGGAPIVAPPVAAPVAPPAPGAPSGGAIAPSAVSQVSAAERAALVAPYLDDKTVAIAWFDLSAINADQLLADATKSRPGVELTEQQKTQMQTFATQAKEVQALVREVNVILSMNDLARRVAPPVIFKLQPGADAKRVFSFLQNQGDLNGPVDQAAFDAQCFVQGDALIVASPGALYRYRNNVAPATVPNIEQAFTLAGNAPAQVIYVPTDDVRQQLGEFTLPPELGIDAHSLMQNISYAAVSLSPPPGFALRVEVQGRDPGAAQQVHSVLVKLFDQFRQLPGTTPQTNELIDALLPKLENDRIVFALREGDPAYQQLEAMAIAGATAGQGAGQKIISQNNLKEIGLAIHNYESATRSFPPVNQNGLSWRVHLLPYLEEQALYSQFNLNEPWDSPQNRPLVEKMPAVFKHPTAQVKEPGMTVYLAVVGENAAFPLTKALSFRDFTDGTSNTAMVVEADADRASIWTRPDDWQLNESAPVQGLGDLWGDGTALVLMVDGSVLPVMKAGDPEQFRRLMVRNDSQVIDFSTIRAPSANGGGRPGGGFPFPIPGLTGPGLGPGMNPAMGDNPLVGGEGFGIGGSQTSAPQGEVPLGQLAVTALQGDQALQTKFGNGKVTRVTGMLKGVLDTTVTFDTGVPGTDGRPISATFIIADRASQPSDLSLDRPATVEGQYESFSDNTLRFTNARWVQPGDPPPGTIIPGQDPEFIAAAKEAFADGRNGDAFKYLYAEALAGPDQHKLRGSLRWAPGLKRPVLAIRWGLAVEYTAPRGYTGGPAPIGRVIQNPGNSGNNGPDPSAPQEGADPQSVIDYYSSEIGTKMLEGMQTRREQGQFGEILNTITQADDPNNNNNINNRGGAPYNQPQHDPAAIAARALAGKPFPIAPGLVFLGVGKQADLLKKAKENDLDAVILVDVGVSPTRTVIINSTRLMLLNGATGKSLYASTPLKATVVETQREQGRGENLVSDLIEKFFAAVDEQFTLSELPAGLNQTNVTAQVQRLTASPPPNPLETLLEVAFWREQDLITDETAKAAYVAILGPDGAKLMGDMAERKAAIQKLLPKSGDRTGDSGGSGASGEGRRIGIGLP
jgi:hypothetical protein